MHKRKIVKTLFIFTFVLCFITLAGLGIFTLINRGNEKLYRAVRSHVRKHGESAVTLGEFMDFDWEQALYFEYTSPPSIYEAIGVNFTGSDLTIGFLFVNDGEIVYYEYFPQRSSGWIDLYPVRLSMQNVGQDVKIFERGDVFEVGSGEDYFGGRLFWMRTQE